MNRKLGLVIIVLALLLTSCAAEETVYTCASVADAAGSAAAYPAFWEAGELSVLVPGLKEEFVPQGIAWLAGDGDWLFAGYSSGKDNSALLAVDGRTGELVKQVKLQNVDGSKYTGHAGGVCVTETDIYVSNAHKLLRLSLDTYESLPASAYCAFEEEIPVPVNASYCSYAEGVLWVGEFQYGSEYPTSAAHKVGSADGLQRAWTCGYRMGPGQDFSAPDYILSMTERIQGMTALNGKIYLSQSYGRRVSSMIYRYSDVLSGPPALTAEVDGHEVPLWILDSSALEAALISPPMAECLCAADGALYVVFESAAAAYKGALNPMDRVFRLTGF